MFFVKEVIWNGMGWNPFPNLPQVCAFSTAPAPVPRALALGHQPLEIDIHNYLTTTVEDQKYFDATKLGEQKYTEPVTEIDNSTVT